MPFQSRMKLLIVALASTLSLSACLPLVPHPPGPIGPPLPVPAPPPLLVPPPPVAPIVVPVPAAPSSYYQ